MSPLAAHDTAAPASHEATHAVNDVHAGGRVAVALALGEPAVPVDGGESARPAAVSAGEGALFAVAAAVVDVSGAAAVALVPDVALAAPADESRPTFSRIPGSTTSAAIALIALTLTPLSASQSLLDHRRSFSFDCSLTFAPGKAARSLANS